MGNYKVSKIYESERELTTQFLTQDVQNTLLTFSLSDPCKFFNSEIVSSELFNVGRRLESLEKEKGPKDADVVILKKYYTALQLKDYLYFSKVNKECNGNYTLNLFFYSNDANLCGQCNEQGLVLTYFRVKDPKIRTYSFDTQLDSVLVKGLVQYYNVTNIPTVVFNDKIYNKFMSKDEIEKVIEG